MKLRSRSNMSEAPIVYLPSGQGVAYKVGQCLKLHSGVATLATGQDKVEYICNATKTGKTGEIVAAIEVNENDTYEAKLSISGSSLKVGDKVTIAEDSIGVTATTEAGVAKIVGFETETKAAGEKVYVKL